MLLIRKILHRFEDFAEHVLDAGITTVYMNRREPLYLTLAAYHESPVVISLQHHFNIPELINFPARCTAKDFSTWSVRTDQLQDFFKFFGDDVSYNDLRELFRLSSVQPGKLVVNHNLFKGDLSVQDWRPDGNDWLVTIDGINFLHGVHARKIKDHFDPAVRVVEGTCALITAREV